MAVVRFEVISRNKKNYMTTIRAIVKEPKWTVSLHLETDTGSVLYPVVIEQGKPAITIMLDSEDMASCSTPPSIPEVMVDSIARDLGMVHDVIAAVRELIQEEQNKLRKGG